MLTFSCAKKYDQWMFKMLVLEDGRKNPKRFSIFKGVYFSHSLKVHIGLTWEKGRFKDPIVDLLAKF